MLRKVPNLTTRNGIFETRIQIPADVRESYGKAVEQVSHGTHDSATAVAMHAIVETEAKQKIQNLRNRAKVAVQTSRPPAPWSRVIPSNSCANL